MTVHLEVDYIRPIPVGSTLQFTGTLLGRQRRKIFTEAVAHIGNPVEPVASAHAIFVTIDVRKHFAAHVEKSARAEEYKRRMYP